MKRSVRFNPVLPVVSTFLLLSGIFAGTARAETVELVTYYPTSSNTGDQHTTSLTVGNNYLNTTLANGQALIQTSLGIGPGFGNNALTNPLTLLQVQGVAGQASQALFLPGAGGTMSLDVAGDLFVRQAAGSGNHVRIRGSSDANAAIELRSETLGGTPYIDFANDAATDADARIRLTGNDRLAIEGAELHIVQDQNAVVGSGLTNPNVGNLAVTDFRVGQDIATLGTQQYGSLRYWSQGTPANAFGFGNPNQVGLITGTAAVNGLTVATLANAPIKFLTNTAGVNNERMRITETGNVGIGTAGAPAASALLEMNSTTRGLLLPRMTTAQRDAIAGPVQGLLIYNTTTNQLNTYTGAAWTGAAGNPVVITGTYVGNGSAARRTIVVPGISAARPIQMVFVFGSQNFGGVAAGGFKLSTMPTTGCIFMAASNYYSTGGPAIAWETNGFSIGPYGGVNSNGLPYNYVALAN